MATLLLVRHALAAAPDDLRLPGPDRPLLPEGRRQAEHLARRIAPLRPIAVWSSNACRAVETAQTVASLAGCAVTLDAALREFDFGTWSGRTYAEVVAADPEAAAWFDQPESGRPPGGESLFEAADRVRAALDRAVADTDGPVVVVGHAGSLRLAVADALGMRLADSWRLRLDCASVSRLDWLPSGPVVHAWNDTAHLATVGMPPEERDDAHRTTD